LHKVILNHLIEINLGGAAMATTSGEVTLEYYGHQYGATFTVTHGMLQVKTHTETRSLELRDRDPSTLAREVLEDIVNALSSGKR
jgi:hypothetical protein